MGNRKRAAVLALCAIAAIASAQSAKDPKPLPDRDVLDTFAVYSALLRNQFGDFRDASQVLIDSATTSINHSDCLKAPEKGREAEYREQIEDYLEKNKDSYRLVPEFDLSFRYHLLDRKDIPPFADWPRGTVYLALSVVGFNAARDRAVVYFEYHCGRLCGRGGIHFLTKKNGKWTVDIQRIPGTCAVIS